MQRTDLLNILIEKKLTLSCMESLTGGLFGATFTSISHASEVYKGGAITYRDEIKELFGVSKKTILEHGAVSKECAVEMAECASDFFSSDVSISFTGNAGPTPSENKPVGLVYIAIKVYEHISVFQLQLEGDRDSIRKQCVDFGFYHLFDEITHYFEII